MGAETAGGKLMWFVAFLVAMAATAVNVSLYVARGQAASLGSAVFCGGLAVFTMLLAVQGRAGA